MKTWQIIFAAACAVSAPVFADDEVSEEPEAAADFRVTSDAVAINLHTDDAALHFSSVELAAKQDYDSFYELEIGLRKIQGVPPFGDLVTVTFTGQEETAVLRGAAKFRDSLISCLRQPAYTREQCTVLGPAPCPVPKINYHFRYRLTLRCRGTKQLRLLLAHLLRQFSQDKLNRGVNAFADVNGYD